MAGTQTQPQLCISTSSWLWHLLWLQEGPLVAHPHAEALRATVKPAFLVCGSAKTQSKYDPYDKEKQDGERGKKKQTQSFDQAFRRFVLWVGVLREVTCCLLEECMSGCYCEAQKQAKMLKENQKDNQNTALAMGYRSPFQRVGVLCGRGAGMVQKDVGVRDVPLGCAWGCRSTRSKWANVIQPWAVAAHHEPQARLCWLLGPVMIYSLNTAMSVTKHGLGTSVFVHGDIQNAAPDTNIPVSPAKPPHTGCVIPTATGSHCPHNSLEPCRQPLVHKLWSTPALCLSESIREGNSAKEKLFCSSSHKEFLFQRRHFPINSVLVR